MDEVKQLNSIISKAMISLIIIIIIQESRYT
jgi:hypothetical protein